MKASTLGLLLLTVFVLCTVTVSAQLSQINMSTPLNNTHVRGTILLSANATRGTNITNVTWRFVNATGAVGGIVVATASNATVNSTFDGTFAFFGRMFDTTTIVDNRYNITANATNGSADGIVINTTLASYQGGGYNITIDNTAPNATLLAPGILGVGNVTQIGNVPIFGNGNTTFNFSFVAQDNLSTNFINVFLVIDGNTNGSEIVTGPVDNVSNVTAMRYISGNFTVNISALSEGYHTWTLNLLDEAGNNASAYPNVSTNNFTVDRSPPVFILHRPTQGFHVRGITGNSTNVNFTFQVIDRFISSNMSAFIMVDSVLLNQSTGIWMNSVVNNTNVTLSRNFTSGIHYWNVTTNDTYANNTNTSITFNFTVDSGAPNITLIFPLEGELLSAGGLTFNWTVTDDFDTNISINLTIDGTVITDYVTGSANSTQTRFTTFLEIGAHNWSITAIDEAGNSNTSITINFTIRTVSSGAGGTGSGGGAGSRTTRQAVPAGGLTLTVFTTGRVSVDVDGTYQLLDLIRTQNNEEADITFGATRATLTSAQPTSLDVDGDGAYDVTVTATRVYSKRVDLRIVPLGQAAPGQATLPSHVIPRRVAFGNTPTGNTLVQSSDPAEESSEESPESPEGEEGTGLEGVTGEVVGEVAGTGGFSVVMLIVSVLVLFAVVGLIYYLYREH